jgi:AraC-like DNA-binding protein
MGLDEQEWLQLSLIIRLEHECIHYLTSRLFNLMRNNLLDELIADYGGIVAACGYYRADWFLRFLGLESFPDYRAGGRLENYHHAITLSDVAKAVGYSGAYLTDLVKRQTGKTVQCWIIKRRIEAACCLLLNTDRSICEIAEAVGYNDKNYFFYQFRQYYGTTPQIWRKMQRSSLKSETNSSLTEKFSIVS